MFSISGSLFLITIHPLRGNIFYYYSDQHQTHRNSGLYQRQRRCLG